MSDVLLEVRDLEVCFPAVPGEVIAVRDVSFRLARGEVLAVVGESGSGKSVTSLAVMRLLPPVARVNGTICFAGHDLRAVSETEMQRLRGAAMTMIFQEPATALNPVMRVGDQIAEAVRAHEAVSRRVAWNRAVEALRLVALPDPAARARDYPHQFSGGMRQRATIAMAIVNRPQLLIADEPTTALDVTIQAQILELLAELRQRFALAMLFISHDLAVVSQIADRIAVMYAGSIIEMGSRQEIFGTPLHPYTRGLLRSVPSLKTLRNEPLPAVADGNPSSGSAAAGCAFEPRCSLRRCECAKRRPALSCLSDSHFVRCPVVEHEAREGPPDQRAGNH